MLRPQPYQPAATSISIVRVTVVDAERALINVITGEAIPLIPSVTGTSEGSAGVRTGGVVITGVISNRALVIIDTDCAVSILIRVAVIACACEGANGVSAGRVGVTVVCASSALIDVATCKAIALTAGVA